MSVRAQIPVVGIVGGIGSGKSTVARWAASQANIPLINGDEVGHEVLLRPDVQEAIRARFGERALDARGRVDRAALGRLVFGSSEETRAGRRDLEHIVHPRIRETIEKRIGEAAAAGRTIVLLDAAVLFEAGWNDLCDAVVFIDVPRDVRLDRLRAGRGWDEAEVARRESSQASLDEKQRRAQFVIDNAGTVEQVGRKLQQVLNQTLAQFPSARES